MKTGTPTNLNLNFNRADAQQPAEKVTLRNKPQTRQKMQKIKAILMMALLVAAGPPLLRAQTTETYTFTTNWDVPDGDPAGLADVRTLNSAIGTITSLKVQLQVTGEYNGDLYAYLRHSSGLVVLLNRVGSTSTNSYGYADSGFNVTFQTGAPNGDIHVYQNVTNPPAGDPLTGIWQPDGRDVDPTNVTDQSSRTTSLTNFNGLNAAGDWTLFVADMDSGGTNMLTQWSLQITGAASPTITWPQPSDIVYGTPLGGSQLDASATYNSSSVSGTFAYSPPSGTVLNAGSGQTLSVTFTPSDTTSYLPVTTNVTINVTQAPLSITANNTNAVYGSAIPTLTASYSGFVNGDSASSLSPGVTVSTTATNGSPVGAYAMTASGAADPNYSISYVGGTFNVTAANITVAANNQTMVYGGTVPTLTANYTGFVLGQGTGNLTSLASLSTTASSSSPVGSYAITASGATSPNYTFTYVPGTLSVTTATLTVTANNQSKAYGAALPALTAAYSGFVNGDTTNNLTALATVTTTATSSSGVGTYPITASGASSTNYAFNYVAGTLTVTNSLTSSLIVSSLNPAPSGSNVTFTATVSAVLPGVGTPDGTVNFRIDGVIGGSGVLSGGVATFSTNSLTRGSHTVVAEYGGSANFAGVTNSLSPTELIDTPPVAIGYAIQRYPTQDVKFLIANALATATDTYGDTLTISFSPTSANGATIATKGPWAYYMPPAGFTNADTFSYTVTDSLGQTGTGTVAVGVETPSQAGQNLTIVNLGNGSVQIVGYGIPGRTYRMQYTLGFSPASWVDIAGGSVTADSTGKFQYTDTPGGQTRYYRSAFP
jgi:subtilisin-like proprotein convertase family protein